MLGWRHLWMDGWMDEEGGMAPTFVRMEAIVDRWMDGWMRKVGMK